MSEQTSNPTLGQNVPKSKFRRKSRQEQTAASKLRMERRGEKLDTAREKLAKQKPPKKPGAVKRLAHTAGHGVHGFVHGKLYEVEHENVGTEGAHRSELAATLQFMQEQNITEYDQLSAKAENAISRFHALTEQLRRTEADLSATSELMGTVVQYAKTRPVFDGYKAAKYSRKYLAEHEAELADYRAAKATMGELLGGEKLPKMAELKEKRRQLAARKKALYADYRTAQEQMRQAVAVKANIDHLLGVTDGQRKKEQER